MTDDDKKRLTEWLGECWHEGMEVKPCSVGSMRTPCSKCGKNKYNRTFTTPYDFFACFNRLVELGEWLKFFAFAHEIVNTDECNAWSWDMDEPEHWAELSQWLLSRTESGHYRLCVLVSEWLTAQKEGVKC